MHKAHVFLAVHEFGQNPDVVSNLIGFAPTEAWVVGAPMVQKPEVPHRFSRWTYQSPLPLEAAVEDHLDALLEVLESHASGVKSVSACFPAHIGCAVYSANAVEGFHLSAPNLARISALGLSFDYEHYAINNS
ncbi:MAG: DUF4279 domain-containing protein [Verrucomicrobiota bacterium]